MRARRGSLRRFWLLAVVTTLAMSCAEDGGVQPGTDVGSDRMAVADVGGDRMAVVDVSDATPTMDEGIDAAIAPDAGASDLGVPRDIAGRDGVADGGIRLEVPVDPMGVPAPGSECTGDAGVRAGDPTIAPPRPVLPQSVSRVTSQRPSFRWVLPEGTTGARVEVCADRCCTRVLQTIDAEGTTVRPTTALPPGVVFWRMFGRRAGVTGSRASYTWEFGVRRRDTPVDSSWGNIRDFTGDGYDDLLILSPPVLGRVQFSIVEGGPSGPRPPRAYVTVTEAPAPHHGHVGDFNGDGRADLGFLGFGSSSSGEYEVGYVIEGGPRDPVRTVRMSFAAVPGARITSPAVTDWNGDGYSDFLACVDFREPGRSGILGSLFLIYLGSPTGLSDRPQEAVRLDAILSRPFVQVTSEADDVDQDGYGDIVVSDEDNRLRNDWTIFFGGVAGGLPRRRPFGGPASGISPGAYFLNIVRAGDRDGDGRGEITFKQSYDPTIYLYSGVSDFFGATRTLVEPMGGGGGLGFGIDREVGDLNGDGLADLLVSSSESTTETWHDAGLAPFNRGRMYVYFGRRDGLAPDPIWFERTRPTDPDDNPAGFAAEIMSPGDLDTDGIDDAVIFDLSRRTLCYVSGSTGLTGGPLGGCASTPVIDIY